jgi:ribosomal protein S18 acetylase RimI-like enzyme
MDSMKIVEVEKVSTNIVDALQKLLPQLTTKYKSFDRSNLAEILNSGSTRLFVALDLTSGKEIVGTYTLVIFRIPTGKILRIEDVIVDEKNRGKGIGRFMMKHAINFAKKEVITKIELTSHPSRFEANKLYQSLGFAKIDTNVYCLRI